MEICELIIDAVLVFPAKSPFVEEQDECRSTQRTLYACALTCRAWRIRAQQRLWGDIHLFTDRDISVFNSVLRIAPAWCITTTAALHLSGSTYSEPMKLTAFNALSMHSLPNLTMLHCHLIMKSFNVCVRTLRMRLPFYAGLKELVLSDCTFDSVRVLLDVVWACPNVSALTIRGCKFSGSARVAAGAAHLSTICSHLRACQKLTSLSLHSVSLTRHSACCAETNRSTASATT